MLNVIIKAGAKNISDYEVSKISLPVHYLLSRIKF